MSILLAILIVWFLISIVASLLIGRIFTAAHDEAGTGRALRSASHHIKQAL